MNYKPLILLTGIGLLGYTVFHGHRLNQDCFLCKYRGLTFLGSSVAFGTFLAFTED